MLTDIESSTRLVQRLGDGYADALADHHRIMRRAIKAHGGSEVKTEGDSFFAIFDEPRDALAAAVDAQRDLTATTWPEGGDVAVRMGLHVGPLTLSDGEYVGIELHRAARIAGAAHGGQIVVSDRLNDAIGSTVPATVQLRSLGDHRLRDFDDPIRLFQVDVEGLRTEFPPLASLSGRFSLPPAELSSFVGRDAEVETVRALLDQARLLTLTGPGGTGKTRLALEVARRGEVDWSHGVAFVPLAPVSDVTLVATTIRGVLKFAEEPGRRSVETLIEKLRQREMVLILDNFEQVAGARATIEELLANTESLKLLVTSRIRLHLSGEQEFSVPPMSVPLVGSDVAPEAIEDNDSVRLFVDRARQARSGFRLDSSNAGAIARLVQRLEGLPLAIELAAARVTLLSPQALLDRLADRLDILDGRGASDSRRTLRGTVSWSHDLLAPDEQVLFRRLAAFSGGATMEMIESLLPRVDLDGAPVVADALEPMAALVDHSLLRLTESAATPRYIMLETIREYGLERLEAAGERAPLARAHAGRFLDRVHELASTFTASPDALDEVEADHANIRAALRWAIDEGETERAMTAVTDLWRFWHLRGHLREGLGVCEEVAAMNGADVATEAAAGARYAHASLLYWQGRTDEALHGYRESLATARAAGARAREAEAQFALAYALGVSQEWDAAHDAIHAAESIYNELDDELGVTNARFTDAYISSLSGDWTSAEAQLRDPIARIEELGDRFWSMNARIVLAWTLIHLQRTDEARSILGDNLEGSIELGDRSMEHMTTQALASVATLQGDTDQALRLVGVAERITEDLGGGAPGGLVMDLDTVGLARERGVAQDRIEALIREGRSLGLDAARELARTVATRAPANYS